MWEIMNRDMLQVMGGLSVFIYFLNSFSGWRDKWGIG